MNDDVYNLPVEVSTSFSRQVVQRERKQLTSQSNVSGESRKSVTLAQIKCSSPEKTINFVKLFYSFLKNYNTSASNILRSAFY